MGGSEFFQVAKPTQREKTSTTMSLRVECSQLVFGKVATLALPRPTAVVKFIFFYADFSERKHIKNEYLFMNQINRKNSNIRK